MARSPASIPGLLRWGRADDAGVADGVRVLSITDRISGSAYTSLTGAANGPVYRASGIGGKPAMEWPTADVARDISLRDAVATDIPADGYTAWAVAYRGSGGGSAATVLGGDDSTTNPSVARTFQVGRDSNGLPRFVTFYGGSASTRIDTGPASVTGVSDVFTGVATATSAEMFVGGASDGPTVAGTNTNGGTRRITVGNNVLSNASYKFVGLIAEWGVYDHALTAAERATLHSYVQDRYGIAVADYQSETTGLSWSLWNGTAEQPLTLAGVWNASSIGPATAEVT